MKKLFLLEFGKARIDNFSILNAKPIFILAENYDQAIELATQEQKVRSIFDTDGSLKKEEDYTNISYIKMLSDNIVGL